MIVVAVVDDNMGMMFNKRRQSKDRALRERILALAGNGKLWMNEYTYQQFSDCDTGGIQVDPDFLDKAGGGEFCFVENDSVVPCAKDIEKIILYRWNRKYPADFRFDINLEDSEWKLAETREFTGSSHEKITEEVYVRG